MEVRPMGTWEPVFWIFGSGAAYFGLLLILDTVKNRRKKG
jgi:hypothetical protein